MSSQTRSPEYDAFVSYASADRLRARRIQAFLQSYRGDRVPHGLRVYLDATDIRGGDLDAELSDALVKSKALIVCCSPAAVASRWVTREIEVFCKHRRDAPVLPLLLSGSLPDALPLPLRDKDRRVHDLRRGLGIALTRNPARDELLRALALLTEVDLRDIINWGRRRLIVQGTTGGAAVAAVAAGSYFYIDQQRAIKLSDLQASLTLSLMDDPGTGDGSKLADWYTGDSALHFGVFSSANPTPRKANWPWQSRSFPLHEGGIHLIAKRQSGDVRRNVTTAGTWVEAVRVFDAFEGDLGEFSRPGLWRDARFEARLQAIEGRVQFKAAESVPASALRDRFVKYYSISEQDLRQREDHDAFVRPLPIVMALSLLLNGSTVYRSVGMPAHVTEHDEDARRLHVAHFPLGGMNFNGAKP